MNNDIIVMKFGGTSVGSPERIRHTALRIQTATGRNRHVVIVVSAIAGETDRLLNLGRELNQLHSDDALREMDALAATGEQVSAALLALALQHLGVAARSFTANHLRIETDGRFQRARIRSVDSKPLLNSLENGIVCVVTGFQGTDEKGNLVTLGRGGSDTSAVALAVALKAGMCEIYKDVDGVYTADPRMVPQARKINSMAFEDMLELTSTGAKVLMSRSVELAMKSNLNLAVRSSFNDSPGTTIMSANKTLEGPVVSGLSHDLNQAKITILGLPGNPESLSTGLAPLAQDDISVDFVTQNIGSDGRMSLAFTIDNKLVPQALDSLHSRLKPKLPELSIQVTQPLAKVSAVGIAMRTHAGVAHRFFSALTAEQIPIEMALSTEIRVSSMIPAADCQRALQALHREFFE